MPSVLIEVRKTYAPEQESALMEAVHAALREAFRILPGAGVDPRAGAADGAAVRSVPRRYRDHAVGGERQEASTPLARGRYPLMKSTRSPIGGWLARNSL